MIREDTLGMISAGVCALAIGSVALFSGSENLSFIPQAMAVLGIGFAGLMMLKGIPRLHVSMGAYVGLVAYWGITLLSEPGVWPDYLTLVKVCLFALACHVVFRSPGRILVLFGVVCTTGAITLAMNWRTLRALGASMSGSGILSEKDRFAGTFDNANGAGVYGVMLMLSGLVVLFNGRRWWRWPLAVAGLLAGLGICYFSGSRKAMLGLGFLFLLIPWMAGQRAESGRRSMLRGLGLGAIVLVLGGLLFSRLPYVERLIVPFTEGIGAESSSETRFAMITRAFELWTTHPFFGCGFEGFSRLSEFGVYSHTTFGEVLCNAGVVGMMLLGLFYFLPGAQLMRLARAERGSAGGRLAVGLLGFWGLFTLFSFFAVLFDSRENIPIYAAICGYVQEARYWGPARVPVGPAVASAAGSA